MDLSCPSCFLLTKRKSEPVVHAKCGRVRQVRTFFSLVSRCRHTERSMAPPPRRDFGCVLAMLEEKGGRFLRAGLQSWNNGDTICIVTEGAARLELLLFKNDDIEELRGYEGCGYAL